MEQPFRLLRSLPSHPQGFALGYRIRLNRSLKGCSMHPKIPRRISKQRLIALFTISS